MKIGNIHRAGVYCSGKHTQNPLRGSISSKHGNGAPKASAATHQVLAAMDEANNNITKMLESLLAKMDEQKVAHDKQIEVQAAFNAHISQDVRGLARQIDLTQADVDATRKTVEGSASPSGSVTTILHQPNAQQQPPPPPSPPPHSPHLAKDPSRPASAHTRPATITHR